MIAPREMPDLPPGYAVKEEEPEALTLRRADGSMVGMFPLSITGPRLEDIQRAAEEDYRNLGGKERRR